MNSSMYVMTGSTHSALPINLNKKMVSTERKIRVYLAEGPVSEAPAAPFAPVVIAHCSK